MTHYIHPRKIDFAAKIITASALLWELEIWEMFLRSRREPLVTARQMAMACMIARKLSTVDTGALFGRDHGTACYASKKIRNLASSDPALAAIWEKMLVFESLPLDPAQIAQAKNLILNGGDGRPREDLVVEQTALGLLREIITGPDEKIAEMICRSRKFLDGLPAVATAPNVIAKTP